MGPDDLHDPVIRYLRPVAGAAWQETARRLACRQLDRTVSPRDLSDIAVVTALAKRNGISRGALLQYDAFVAADHRVQLLDASRSLRGPLFRVAHRPASTYVFHSGVPETAMLMQSVLPHAARAFRIGYWAWELPEPPPDWRRFGGLMSEIWVPSRFVATSLGALFDCPIRVVPHQVEVRPQRARTPGRPLVVLVMADSRSSFDRKNPAAAVAAFQLAFRGAPSARLVVKLNGDPAETEVLAAAFRRLPHVRVVTDFLDDAALSTLYRSADVFLSLHRAEGFGLPMLEAMAHGVPVVGTAWSGNMDFMTPSNSLLVPFEMVPVRDRSGIYSAGLWADPDVAAAADLLRQLALDPVLHSRLARAAHETAAALRAEPVYRTERLGLTDRWDRPGRP